MPINPPSSQDPQDEASADDGERELRGRDLKETEKKRRNPDRELRLDGEKDTLYTDDLDTEEDSEPLAGTRGSSSGIKP